MAFLMKPLKIIAFLFLVLTFLFISFFMDISVRDKRRKLYFFSRISSFYLSTALRVVSLKVTVKNADRLKRRDKNFLIISNHLSYIDIFVIYSVTPSVFVANSELRDDFLLGTIIRYSGGVFVERRHRGKLMQDMHTIKNILNMGLNAVIFPEGTTSDGERVRPFKSSLLAAAGQSGVDVLPVCIRYLKIDGQHIDAGNRHLIYYYGSVTFFEHFLRLLGLRSISVELVELEPIEFTSGLTRKELADTAYERISGSYSGKQAFGEGNASGF